jgi:uncharacterized protein YjbJ (UPF0337 family)
VTNSAKRAERRLNMNEDILKGTWLEIRGRVKERWGKLTDNDFCEIEGRGEKLLGLLQKKYGYVSDKAELVYKDSVELAEIVGSIRRILTKMKDIRAIAFIARYGQPLLAKNQESQIAGKEKKHRYDTDRYSYSRLSRRNTHLAPQ